MPNHDALAIARWHDKHPQLITELGHTNQALAEAAQRAQTDRTAAGLQRIHDAADQLATAVEATSAAMPMGAPSADAPYMEALTHFAEAARIAKEITSLTTPADALTLNRSSAELAAGTVLTRASTTAIQAISDQRSESPRPLQPPPVIRSLPL